jgi:CheY-like chemotaxis protein
VDDDEVSRSIAARMLERLDLKPTTAATGDSALTLLREGETFAAALCDMILPDIRGEELLVRLHAIQPELRIIACSGFSEKRLNLLLEKGLVKSFLPKPYRLADLRKAIAQALTP